jgi:integrase
MTTNRLTEGAIRGAIKEVLASGKRQKLFDGDGLFLLIEPRAGATFWRQKYRYGGVEKGLAHGKYPTVSLKRAREKRSAARQLLDRQIDPMSHKKALARSERAAKDNTLGAVAVAWFNSYCEGRAQERRPLAPATVEKTQWLLNLPAYRAGSKIRRPHPLNPILGRPVTAITKDDIASVINAYRRRDAIETAHRLLDRLGRVFRYAVGVGLVQSNPVAAFRDSPDPRDKLPAVREKHHAAITDPKGVGGLLRAIGEYDGQPITVAALRLAPYVFLRPGELRNAKWTEIELESDEPTWRIPAERTKTRRELLVPLATQCTEILREVRSLTGTDGLVFPSESDPTRPISENTLTSALRRLGYSGQQQTVHGFRSIAATLLRERGHEETFIERQMDHLVGNDVQQAYDRSRQVPERRKMMQRYADYLDSLKAGAKVVPIRRRA